MRKILKGIISSALAFGMLLPAISVTVVHARDITVKPEDVNSNGNAIYSGAEVEYYIWQTKKAYPNEKLVFNFGGMKITGGFNITVADIEICNANIEIVNDTSQHDGNSDVQAATGALFENAVTIREKNITIRDCVINAANKYDTENIAIPYDEAKASNIKIIHNEIYPGLNRDYQVLTRTGTDTDKGTGIGIYGPNISNIEITDNTFTGYRSKNSITVANFNNNQPIITVKIDKNKIYGTYISGPYLYKVNGADIVENYVYGSYSNRPGGKYGEPGLTLSQCTGILNAKDNYFKNCSYAFYMDNSQPVYFMNNNIEYSSSTPVHVVRESVASTNTTGIFGKYDQVNLGFDYEQARSSTNLDITNFVDYFYKSKTATNASFEIASSINVALGSTFNPQSYVIKSTDANGNTVVPTVTHNVNTGVAGTYSVTYTHPTLGSITRTVIVSSSATNPSFEIQSGPINVALGSTFNPQNYVLRSTDAAGNYVTPTITYNNVNTNVPGTYSVTYSHPTLGSTTRTVIVSSSTTNPSFEIQASPINVALGSTFNPQNYVIRSTDAAGNTVTPTITYNNVNTNVAGTYSVTYNHPTLGSTTRTVIVGSGSGSYPYYYYNYSSTTPSTDVKTISDPFVYVGTFVAPPTTTTTETTTTKKDKTKKNAVINAKDRTLKVGDKFVFMEGVTAADNGGKGKDLTDKVTMTGTINTLKPGAYKMTYKVTGANGKTVSKAITVTVK